MNRQRPSFIPPVRPRRRTLAEHIATERDGKPIPRNTTDVERIDKRYARKVKRRPPRPAGVPMAGIPELKYEDITRKDEDGLVYDYREAIKAWTLGAYVNRYFHRDFTLDQCFDIRYIANKLVRERTEDALGIGLSIDDFNFYGYERLVSPICLARLLVEFGFESMLDAYEAGVPAEDIIA